MRSLTIIAAAVLALLSAAPTQAQTCDELVSFATLDGTIEISHLQAMNNCCCTIDIQVDLEGFALDVHEYEILEGGGCDCLCCFDMEVSVGGLEPGDYTVTIVKHTEYAGIEYLGPWTVTVMGNSPPSVCSTFVPCASTAAPQSTASWGVIKALYR